MNGRLLEVLSEITDEEREILSGKEIDKTLYTDGEEFTVDSGKVLSGEKLVDVRPHTRFTYFPKHKHNYIELIYMCKGKTRHTINSSDKVELNEGEILLLGADAEHEVDAAEMGDIAVNFIIKPEFFNVTLDLVGYGNSIYNFIMTELSENGDECFMKFDVSDMLPIKNLIENMIWFLKFSDNENFNVQNTTMGLIFAELSERTETLKSGQSLKYEQEIALKTAQYIESSFKTARLSELAEKLHLPVVTLSRMIKAYNGDSFKEWLQKKRLQEAEKLIVHTKIPITEIIYSVGYENTNFFYKMFSNKYGCSPKEYRTAHLTHGEKTVVKKVK